MFPRGDPDEAGDLEGRGDVGGGERLVGEHLVHRGGQVHHVTHARGERVPGREIHPEVRRRGIPGVRHQLRRREPDLGQASTRVLVVARSDQAVDRTVGSPQELRHEATTEESRWRR